MSCLQLAQLFVEAGGPPGVFNVVNGARRGRGQRARAARGRRARSRFTGSTEVGKLMLQYAGQSNMKRVALECGGKSPQVFVGRPAPTSIARSPPPTRGIYAEHGRSLQRRLAPAGRRARSTTSSSSASSTPGKRGLPARRSARSARPTWDRWSPSDAQTRVLGCIDTGRREGAQLRVRRRCAAESRVAALRAARPCSPACATT